MFVVVKRRMLRKALREICGKILRKALREIWGKILTIKITTTPITHVNNNNKPTITLHSQIINSIANYYIQEC